MWKWGDSLQVSLAVSLILITGCAVLDDLYRGRISNGIIVTGLFWGAAYQLLNRGLVGLICFLGGVFLPLLLLAGLYYFRMIGGGDLKLFAVIGGFLGPAEVFFCMVTTILLGGLIALFLMLHRQNFFERMLFLSTYLAAYSRERRWRSYLAQTGAEARFCFSIPVFLAVLWYVIRR